MNSIIDAYKKLEDLKAILKDMGHMIVAYSGGVDSTFLLKIANDVLDKNVIAVTGDSPTMKRSEMLEATAIAREIGAIHKIINTGEMCNADFTANPENRCYFCKIELFAKLQQYAEEIRYWHVIDGSNYDDRGDYRPGRAAAAECGVRSPLLEAGLTKQDIRMLAHKLGLSVWNKTAQPCLSSRLPYGIEITAERLKMIEEAEEFLSALGFIEFRVRYHGHIARIEAQPEEFRKILEPGIAVSITKRLQEIGFTYVTVDLAGFKSGSLNAENPPK